MYRILGSAIIVLLIMFFPYWVYTPALVLAMIYFPFFWEGIILAMFIDLLYGAGSSSIYSLLISPFATTSIILTIIILLLRERLRTNV